MLPRSSFGAGLVFVGLLSASCRSWDQPYFLSAEGLAKRKIILHLAESSKASTVNPAASTFKMHHICSTAKALLRIFKGHAVGVAEPWLRPSGNAAIRPRKQKRSTPQSLP